MLDNGILDNWLSPSNYLSNFDFLIHLEEGLELSPNPLRRFFALYFPNKTLAENLAIRMHLTKRQKETMIKWAENKIGLENILEEQLRRKLIFRFGKEFCIDKLIIEAARTQTIPEEISSIISDINETIVPIFPISGKDIIKAGKIENSQIGLLLDKLKEDWIASDFSLSREDLLQKIQQTMPPKVSLA